MMRYRDFEIEIEYKRIKNMYLKIKDKGVLSITAPYGTSTSFIISFIDSKYSWILKTTLKMDEKIKTSLAYKGGDVFYVYGVKKTLKDNVNVKNLYKALNEDVLIKASRYVDKYMPFLNSYGYYKRPVLKMRSMTSKWGVCYTLKNTIVLNNHLIHYPLECLEYIVLHEMCHFIEANHSKRFYSLIERNLHNYKEIKKKLY